MLKVNHKAFIDAQKNIRRRPRKSNEKAVNKVFSGKEFRQGIRNAALSSKEVKISYTKITTGETKSYTVRPYSYRYRKTRDGIRKMLFAEDPAEHRVKGFVLRNINSSETVDTYFSPKWRIEIGNQ